VLVDENCCTNDTNDRVEKALSMSAKLIDILNPTRRRKLTLTSRRVLMIKQALPLGLPGNLLARTRVVVAGFVINNKIVNTITFMIVHCHSRRGRRCVIFVFVREH
jgi:hypothetical protein